MKCINYNACYENCLKCDFPTKIKCNTEFDFDKPIKYKLMGRRDIMSYNWNICPTCGNSIGYYPKNNEFRCPRCTQRISWK